VSSLRISSMATIVEKTRSVAVAMPADCTLHVLAGTVHNRENQIKEFEYETYLQCLKLKEKAFRFSPFLTISTQLLSKVFQCFQYAWKSKLENCYRFVLGHPSGVTLLWKLHNNQTSFQLYVHEHVMSDGRCTDKAMYVWLA
jgi:hypothetical protein